MKHIKRLHVAVGVIFNQHQHVLISRRAKSSHQGGLWEFPGGKVEAGESVQACLARELDEELGIRVVQARPLIQVRHDYPDLKVLLDVWKVTQFAGQPRPRERQPLQWVPTDRLHDYDFPEANQVIIKAIQLPDYYAIVNGNSAPELLKRIESLLSKDIKLIQLRVKSMQASEFNQLIEDSRSYCKSYQAELLFNSALFKHPVRPGVSLHLTSQDLKQMKCRPHGIKLLAASCHNQEELAAAERLGVDFAVLSPVCPTASHPDSKPMGWPAFTELLEQVNIPIYALGGMRFEDLHQVQQCGGQGIAGISLFAQ